MYTKKFDKFESFVHELSHILRLDHPYIIHIFSFEKQNIIMPLAECNLKEYIEKYDIPSIEDRINYINRIGEALDYIHSRRIVHLDLKLNNILMIEGLPYLNDFGNAKYIEEEIYPSICNSEYYRAPEACELLDIDNPIAIDMWAFGVIIILIDKWASKLFKFILGERRPESASKLIEVLYGTLSLGLNKLVDELLHNDPRYRRMYYNNLEIEPIIIYPVDNILEIKEELDIPDYIFDRKIETIPELWISCIEHGCNISNIYCEKKMYSQYILEEVIKYFDTKKRYERNS